MKQSKVIISVIVAASVLLAAIAIGLYVRENRQTNRPDEFVTVAGPETTQAELTTEHQQENQQNSLGLSPEQKAQRTKQIEIIKQQWVNMSEQERKEFRAKLLETFDARRQDAESKVRTSPPEGRDKYSEEFLEIKNKWEDMTEEERQEFMEKMRENANAIRQGND